MVIEVAGVQFQGGVGCEGTGMMSSVSLFQAPFSVKSQLPTNVLHSIGKRPPRSSGHAFSSSIPFLIVNSLPSEVVVSLLEDRRVGVGRSALVVSGPRRGVTTRALNSAQYRLEKEKKADEDEEQDDELCPVECVREFRSQAEFEHILAQAQEQGSLVVVDFFRTSCGSCKYIEKGFVKLCKGAGSKDAHVVFCKHNVMDEYEEQSEVADSLRIKVVPLFLFYKDGVLVDSFPTRDKARILEAICKHTELNFTLADLEF